MFDDARLLFVAPLLAFFGCKLLITSFLFGTLGKATWGAAAAASFPVWFGLAALGGLAILQFTVLVGIALHRHPVRPVGAGLCIVGGAVGGVLILLSPLAWILGTVVVRIGTTLVLLNVFTLLLIFTEEVRDWCDE